MLPHSITQPGTLILNIDPHTKRGSYWLAVNFQSKSYSCYYFDFYDLAPYIPSIQEFLKRTCIVSEYNKTQLQGLSITVCGKYCCLFALYTDRGYTPKHFVSLFEPGIVDGQITRLFASEFGPLHKIPRGCGKYNTCAIKGELFNIFYSFLQLNMKEVVIDFPYLRGRRDEIKVKKLSLAAKDMIQSIISKAPMKRSPTDAK
jgi:hypothetical protein